MEPLLFDPGYYVVEGRPHLANSNVPVADSNVCRLPVLRFLNAVEEANEAGIGKFLSMELCSLRKPLAAR